MKKAILLLLFLIIGNANAQELRLKKGVVIDSVQIPSSDSISQSYALYLPKRFDIKKSYGVVFVFDPAGRGREGVAPFVQASEQFQLIIACSNNSKNGSYSKNFNVYNKLSDHIGAIFKIDLNQVYLAGFSGGSRLATAIGTLADNISGVLGCGAGMPNLPNYLPRINKYPYIGIVGDEDANYVEMQNTKKYLSKLKISNELLVFDGGHSWPPQAYIAQAFGWIYVKRSNQASMALSVADYQKQYQQHYNYAKQQEDGKKWKSAFDAYGRIIENYKGRLVLDSLKAFRKKIRRNKEYKAFVRNENNVLYEERLKRETYQLSFSEDVEDAAIENLPWWEDEIRKLKILKGHPNPLKRKMGARLRNLLSILAVETANNFTIEKHIDKLQFLNEFLVMLRPEYHEPYIKLMKIYYKKSEYQNAIGVMQQLFDNGFTDKERIQKEEGITLLKVFPEYLEIMKQKKKN